MSTIMPNEKRLQDAVRWISENRETKDVQELIKEACFKYNLNPKEEEYLLRLFREEEQEEK